MRIFKGWKNTYLYTPHTYNIDKVVKERKFAVEYLQKPEENEKITINVEKVKQYLGTEIFLHDHNLKILKSISLMF